MTSEEHRQQPHMKNSEHSRHQRRVAPRDIPLDALIDDLVGLNWRALKTLGISFSNPLSLSRAAWSVDWENRFTPTFRLWFTLVAILFFFQFFWASKDSAIIAMFADQIQSRNGNLPEGVSFSQAATTFARINFAIVPFTSAMALFLLGYFYRAWGSEVPVVVRIRYVFLIVLPSTAVSIILFMLVGVAPVAHVSLVLLLTWLVPVPIDIVIAYRSVFSDLNGRARVWRSLALGFAITGIMILAGYFSTLLSAIWIWYRYQ